MKFLIWVLAIHLLAELAGIKYPRAKNGDDSPG